MSKDEQIMTDTEEDFYEPDEGVYEESDDDPASDEQHDEPRDKPKREETKTTIIIMEFAGEAAAAMIGFLMAEYLGGSDDD